MHVDAVITREHDLTSRYRRFWAWTNQSCGIDASLFAAVQLDLGILQCDLLPPSSHSALNYPANLVRTMMVERLGDFVDESMDAFKDSVRRSLCTHKPDVFKMKGMMNVSDIVKTLFHGSPQNAWTEVSAAVTCKGQVVLEPAGVVRRQSGWDARGGHSLGQMLQKRFISTASQPCICTESCTNSMFRIRLVLDRLPGTMIIHLPETVTLNKEKTYEPTLDIKLDYWAAQRKGITTAKYRLVGTIISTGNHYYGRWYEGSSYESPLLIQYDGLLSRHAVVLNHQDFFRDLPTTHGLQVCFYRLIFKHPTSV